MTDADGRTTTYAYDGGRLTTDTQYNADGTVNDVLSYTYDCHLRRNSGGRQVRTGLLQTG